MGIRIGKSYYIAKEPTETRPRRFELITNGKAVVIFDWIQTFVYKDEKTKLWSVTELRTGVWVGTGNTQKKAIASAKENIEHLGKERILGLIEDMVVKYGETPPVDNTLLTAEKQTIKIKA